MDINMLIKVIGVFLSILAFSIYLETPKKFILKAGFVAALGGLIYLLIIDCGKTEVTATFFSALVVAFISHIFARVFKTPVTIFLVAGILPTVPGAGMYRIVHNLLLKDEALASFYFIQTLEIAGTIALAIFIVDSIFRAAQKGDWLHKAHLK